MDILEVFWIIFIRYWTVDPENFFVKVKISKKKRLISYVFRLALSFVTMEKVQ